MARTIGIDLGTTWARSAVADGSRVRHLAAIPSVIGVTATGEWLLGEAAIRHGAVAPGTVLGSLRRMMGDAPGFEGATGSPARIERHDGAGVALGARAYPLAYVCAHLLAELKEQAEAALGETVTRAVMTVPAAFHDDVRQRLLDAARVAGFEHADLVDEAAAVGLAACGAATVPRGSWAVVHAGGGVAGAAVMRCDGEGVAVLSSAGAHATCGERLDERLVELVARRIHEQHGVDLRRDPTAAQRLRAAARRAREALSTAEWAEITLPFVGSGAHGAVHLVEVVTRAEFERATGDLFDEAGAMLARAIAEAPGERLERVFVSGGLQSTPRLRSALATAAQRELEFLPNTSACAGAALLAAAPQGRLKARRASAARATALGHDARATLHEDAEVAVTVDVDGGPEPRMSTERTAALSRELTARRSQQRRRRELADLRNDADGLAFTTQRALEEYGALLPPAIAATIVDEVEGLKAAMESDDAERIAQAVRTLEKSAMTISAAVRAHAGEEP